MIVINGLPKAYANLGETMAFAAMQHVDALEPGRHEWKTWVTQGLLSFKLNGIRYVVPEGFMTDFSSVPRVFRWLFSPSGEPHQSAGLIHDVLYSSTHVTRKDADLAFRAAARMMGQSGVGSQLMYMALRVGGYPAWRANRKSLIEGGPRWRFIE